jgi:hypothetical protein
MSLGLGTRLCQKLLGFIRERIQGWSLRKIGIIRFINAKQNESKTKAHPPDVKLSRLKKKVEPGELKDLNLSLQHRWRLSFWKTGLYFISSYRFGYGKLKSLNFPLEWGSFWT